MTLKDTTFFNERNHFVSYFYVTENVIFTSYLSYENSIL